jgi:hypothetical protein
MLPRAAVVEVAVAAEAAAEQPRLLRRRVLNPLLKVRLAEEVEAAAADLEASVADPWSIRASIR